MSRLNRKRIRNALSRLEAELSRIDFHRIRFIPDGANDQLPAIPLDVTISESDIKRALSDWDLTFPELAGMLDAEVVGKKEYDRNA